MNGWKLWLDDDAGKGLDPFRDPPEVDGMDWHVAHTSLEATKLIDRLGPPCYISFDHDLGVLPDGSEDTAMHVIRHLTDHYYDADVSYDVHSKNGPGSLNIISKMDSWKRSKTL